MSGSPVNAYMHGRQTRIPWFFNRERYMGQRYPIPINATHTNLQYKKKIHYLNSNLCQYSCDDEKHMVRDSSMVKIWQALQDISSPLQQKEIEDDATPLIRNNRRSYSYKYPRSFGRSTVRLTKKK
ncbi:unnamed protein product [Lepeophtheirus salmonis]|uniref:(salmon louse) hypothetical protein n=1 Tax=Lepeophtheirus salmonis TaxID=72036 RepID=A0A7R8H918_LEPSM|nr:unnamed protein product [Lepeophtheirus salmonis]CAF2949470.1 unnamed protein product [Lepeophtheirus salmonis]